MPRRVFMPPSRCDYCGDPPLLGETLHHRDGWCCAICLAARTPGKDATSKTAFYNVAAQFSRTHELLFEAAGEKEAAQAAKHASQWHADAADLLRQAATNRARASQVALGEAVPQEPGYLQEVLAVPDFIAIDASLERTRLLMESGSDALALALDAANSAGAKSSLEKMHLHQLAVLHKTALDQMRRAAATTDPDLQAMQYKTASRLIRDFQHGLTALTRLRGGGVPIVQHVHVNEGGQAVVGTVQKGGSHDPGHPAGGTR